MSLLYLTLMLAVSYLSSQDYSAFASSSPSSNSNSGGNTTKSKDQGEIIAIRYK